MRIHHLFKTDYGARTVSEYYTTRTIIQGGVTLETPYSTVTILTTTTAADVEKRAAQVTARARIEQRDPGAAALIHRVREVASSAALARRQDDGIDVDAAVSSFCLYCRDNLAPTTTESYAGLPTVRHL